MCLTGGRSASHRRGRHLAQLFVIAALLAPPLHVGANDSRGDTDAGRTLFTKVAQPACSVCHILAAAGATGRVGPNLDELRPDEQRVARAVNEGVGAMPAFAGKLSGVQIDALAKYVARVAASPK